MEMPIHRTDTYLLATALYAGHRVMRLSLDGLIGDSEVNRHMALRSSTERHGAGNGECITPRLGEQDQEA